MEWSHTHFDGYELLAIPSDSPPSLLLLDSSALVLVQRVRLPTGDSAPRAVTWQPGGARTGCSSGALACIVVTAGGSPELAVFTPDGVHLSSRVRYSWSCAARVPISPLHRGLDGRILLAWSCRGPLVVADQALSVWSNSRSVPGDTINSLSSDGESDDEGTSSDDDESEETSNGTGTTSALPPRRSRPTYRNSVRLERKWARKSATGSSPPLDGAYQRGNKTKDHTPYFKALATSPCGYMFAAACEGASDVIIWLRRSNLASRSQDGEMRSRGSGVGSGSVSAVTGKSTRTMTSTRGPHTTFATAGLTADAWDFQPATVLAHEGALVQVAWGRGPGNQQDYLLTLEEDGNARVWVEQGWQERDSPATETGTIRFLQAASIKSWYGRRLRLDSIGFVKWAYFGSHGKDLALDQGRAPGSAYHLVHRQEQEAEGGTRPVRSDNCVVGCGQDGRLFLWSLQDMPLPDGRTTPGLLEVASLTFKWLAGSVTQAPSSSADSRWVLPRISAVGYYDAQGAGGAPTELQAVARAADGALAVITARLHHETAKGKFTFRNTRSVVLPLGLGLSFLAPSKRIEAGTRPSGVSSRKRGEQAVGASMMCEDADGVPHPNLPLLARVRRVGGGEDGDGGDGWKVEVHSWVNGGSHLQCIPCKPRGHGRGEPGHTAGAELMHTDGEDASVGGGMLADRWLASESKVNGAGLESVAPLFGELAAKVKSGDELSFVPYALPGVRVGCSLSGTQSGRGRSDVRLDECADDVSTCDGACREDREDGSGDCGGGGGRIAHAMWLADWVGAEALPPALAIIDGSSRLHVFELDDGAIADGAEDDRFDVNDGMPAADLVKRRSIGGMPTGSSTGSLTGPLSHSMRNLSLKGVGGTPLENYRERSSNDRPSRRAQADASQRLVVDEGLPAREKTVVLPLDSKYGLGLTLAFQDNQVEVATFVRHPDTGEMLPAEASGRIRPGDELVDINGNNVEGMNGDEATALIRKARRQSMEGGAVTLELTFREATPAPGTTPARSGSASPKPRTGWYRSSRRAGRSPSASPAGEWASTDADQQSLRWRSIGTADIPAFETCVLLPWRLDNDTGGSGDGSESSKTDSTDTMDHPEAPWTEFGVYPPGDSRKRRQALLVGFRAAAAYEPERSMTGDAAEAGCVVALLLEVGATGGVTATELCRTPLEQGQEPVAFNKEKKPPGTPTSGRSAVEAVCSDGWIRRWCLISLMSASGKIGSRYSAAEDVADKKQSRFAVKMVDICRPFHGGNGSVKGAKTGADSPGVAPMAAEGTAAAATTSTASPNVGLIAVASPSLIAIARKYDPSDNGRTTSTKSSQRTSVWRGRKTIEPSEASDEATASPLPNQSPPIVEVWSCSTALYPRGRFRKEGPVMLRGIRDSQTVEGMCWVTPEIGDERGASVSGHCLCVSVEGTVTVLARERRKRPSVGAGLSTAAESGANGSADDGDTAEGTWSPVFRVANPCSLLTCHTAGLRDFCQGLMAKYQRNLALSLVRSRRRDLSESIGTTDTSSPENTDSAETHVPPPPLPLSRVEIDSLRGGTTREGRSLEDWHPENLVAMWCTSLLAPQGGRDENTARTVQSQRGAAWTAGRERMLSVLRWVSAEAAAEAGGGVTAGTVVPVLAHGRDGQVSIAGAADDGGGGDLGQLSATLAAYVKQGQETNKEGETGGRESSGRPWESMTKIDNDADAAVTAVAAAGVPRRLLSLSPSELVALAALLDEALGLNGSRGAGNVTGKSLSSSGDAADTAAALFSKPSSEEKPVVVAAPAPPVANAGYGTVTSMADDCANVFLLARGLCARLAGDGGVSGIGGNDPRGSGDLNSSKTLPADSMVASSSVLGMLLASTTTQADVLEKLCPKDSGGGLGGALGGAGGDVASGITWNDARALMVPLWLRDVKELQRVTTALAANTYRQDRDLMGAALFYTILGNDKKLVALAKADSGFLMQRNLSGAEASINTRSGKAQGATPGQRLEKLLAHDFSSPRGRTVAGKNAFILLRKRDYRAAAAVFLLARPAMLKEALQVLLVHVKDLQLALLVTRLIEVRDAAPGTSTAVTGSRFGGGGLLGRGGLGGGFGAGRGFGGGFGGGGWGDGDEEPAPDANAAYASLGRASRKLIRAELLPMFDGENYESNSLRGQTPGSPPNSTTSMSSLQPGPYARDAFLEAASLFWLGQSERALRAICRGQPAEMETFDGASSATTVSPITHTSPKVNGTGNRARTAAAATAISAAADASDGNSGSEMTSLGMCNRAIDVATRPLLVAKLQRARKHSSGGSAASGGYGILRAGGTRTPSMQVAGDTTIGKGEARHPGVSNAQRAVAARLATAEYFTRNGMEISALEVLGRAEDGKWSVELAKEIADESRRQQEDAAAADKTTTASSPGFSSGPGALAGFGISAARSASAGAASGDIPDGGIFDSFGGPPPPSRGAQKPAGGQLASGELSGDIFGGFDGPPRVPQSQKTSLPKADAMTSGELSGDLFGGFDGPPRPKPKPQNPVGLDSLGSGELGGDMFGSFDGPPRPVRVPAASRPSTTDTSQGPPGGSAVWSAGSSPATSQPASPDPEKAVVAKDETLERNGYGFKEGEEPDWRIYDDFAQRFSSEEGVCGGCNNDKDVKSRSFSSGKVSVSEDDDIERWAAWAQDLAYEAATKRLLRELRYLLGGLDALAPTASNMAFALESVGKTLSAKSQASNKAANATSGTRLSLLESVQATAQVLCESHGLSTQALTAAAAGALCHTWAGGSRRLGAFCLLLYALDRPVAADAAVCAAAGRLLQSCSVHGGAHLEDLSLKAAQAKAMSAISEATSPVAEGEATTTALDANNASETSRPSRAESKAESIGSRDVSSASGAMPGAAVTTSEAGGLGLENLRPHLSELRSAAFQLELCLSLHARGCLNLSARARAEAAVGFRAGLLVEALGRRYDVMATLVEYPPAPLTLDELVLSGCELEQDPKKTSAVGSARERSPNDRDPESEIPPPYSRFKETRHRLSQLNQGTEKAVKTGFGTDLPPGLALAKIAEHEAFCDGFSRADAEAALQGLELGTFLFRSYSGGRASGNGARNATGGGDRSRSGAKHTPKETNAVVMSVTSAGGLTGSIVRHLVLRAVEPSGDIDFENEDDEDGDGEGGVSCGIIGPDRNVDSLLLRIRKMFYEDNSATAASRLSREGASAGLDTPNASLLEALSRLPQPEFEALGLEPWESSLSRPTTSSPKHDTEAATCDAAPTEETPPSKAVTYLGAPGAGADENIASSRAPSAAVAADDERLCLVRLTESLSRGVWPTYARLACALNLLSLRSMHAHLCNSLADLLHRREFRVRAPLSSRVCGAVPFLPAADRGEVGSLLSKSSVGGGVGMAGGKGAILRDFGGPVAGSAGQVGGGLTAAATTHSSSSTFYLAFLHPLYVWAQCLDRQFYAQAHRPTVAPAHHLIPRRRGRLIPNNTLLARATGGEIPALTSSGGVGEGDKLLQSPRASLEFKSVSPRNSHRECCPYLFQRGMVVSEEGVRGAQDHLRCEETWPEEDSEERIAHQALNGIRNPDGSIVPSVPLHMVKDAAGAEMHHVEAFYSSDARAWLLQTGIDPAGPASGARLRKWENMGIVQRVKQMAPSGNLNFRGERHKGDTLLRFVDRWEVEQCGDASGGALRAGPLGRMRYLPVPANRSSAGRETLYGRLLYAIGGIAASEMWTKLGAEDWLVKTISRAEFPFSYRHQLADFSAGSGGTWSAGVAPRTPAAAAAAASDMSCPFPDRRRQEHNSFCLCVFEHLCRNALFRRLRLPHRFQALVSVHLLGLKNLSPHYHPSKTDVFAAVSLNRPDHDSSAVGRSNYHHADARRVGKDTSVTAVKRLLPTANGQSSQQSRWGAKAAFRFALPEEASPYILSYGDRAYELVMGRFAGRGGRDGDGGAGAESLGLPKCVRITVWKKTFVSEQRLGEVEVPLNMLDDRGVVDEWVALRGDKGSSWFVNVRFSLRFVMVSVSDPNPVDDTEVDEGEVPESPGMTMSHALADVDIM